MALGVLCTALGVLGYMLPVLPGTVFLIVAVWAFSKSSPRLESWLMTHPLFGRTLTNWYATRSLTLRTKVLAIGIIGISVSASLYFLHSLPHFAAYGLTLVLVAAWAAWFLASRPTSAA
jgi:uncharacterized protein